jgi:D-3-phosphoglycerate dehydrogenase
MKLNVLWRSNLGKASALTFKSALESDFELAVETDKDKALDYLEWLHILVDGNPTEALLDAPKLEHVIVPYVGINKELRDHLLARPHLKLHNAHFNGAFVAQHAVALLLACANRLIEADLSLRKGDWTIRKDDGFFSMFLPGKTCLLLGYGAIGREIEQRVRCLGMDVIALRRQPQNHSATKEYGPSDLLTALAEADAVMISLPSTPETKGMLNETAFQAMKPGSIVVNVGRGDVINQHALYQALASGRLLGAGLDVWWNYPKDEAARARTFPADAPLHELPNVVMSPHRASLVADWDAASFRDVVQTLNALAGGKNRSQVDPVRGY